MAFFDFINEFVNDNEKELQAAADGAAAVWSIGSRLAGIAADLAVDTAKEAYASLTEEKPVAEPAESKVPESTATDDLKALTKELKDLQRQNEALQRRLQELEEAEAEREAMEEQSCLDCEIQGEDYYNSLSEDELEEDCLHEIDVYENISQRELVVKLAGYGEAYAVQAMNYLINKYSSGANLPWVKVDMEERCVTILRPESGFTYVGDDTVEEIL